MPLSKAPFPLRCSLVLVLYHRMSRHDSNSVLTGNGTGPVKHQHTHKIIMNDQQIDTKVNEPRQERNDICVLCTCFRRGGG